MMVEKRSFFMSSNADPEQRVEITYNSEKSLDDSNIKANTKTIMIVDGFLSDSTAPMSIGLPKSKAKLILCFRYTFLYEKILFLNVCNAFHPQLWLLTQGSM